MLLRRNSLGARDIVVVPGSTLDYTTAQKHHQRGLGFVSHISRKKKNHSETLTADFFISENNWSYGHVPPAFHYAVLSSCFS